MAAFGALALALPEWLTEVRLGRPVRTVARTRSVRVDELHKTGRTPLGILRQGLRESLWTAEWALTSSRRSEATNALDAALRAAEVGVRAAPSPGLKDALSAIREARRALQTSDSARAEREIHASQRSLEQDDTTATPSQAVGLERYADAPVVDARGVIIGEVRSVRPRKLELAIGGVRDAWGFFDLSAQAVVPVHESRLLFGPHGLLAKSYVMLPVNA